MFPLFFNPATNQICYSLQFPNQFEKLFLPISFNNIQKNFFNNSSPYASGQVSLNNRTSNAKNSQSEDPQRPQLAKRPNMASSNENKPQKRAQHQVQDLSDERSKKFSLGASKPSSGSDNTWKSGKKRACRYTNLQIKVKLDNQNANLCRQQLKNKIRGQLKRIRSSVQGISNIKILFSDTNKASFGAGSGSSRSKSPRWSTSNDQLDASALETVEQSIQNVLVNSPIFTSTKAHHKGIIRQLLRVIREMLTSINFKNMISFESNFFKLMNLQVPIDPAVFAKLKLGSRIKIFCYLFCKYFRKNRISALYAPFYRDVATPFSSDQNLASGEACDDPEQTIVASIFWNYSPSRFDLRLLRKLLILLVQHLDLVADYLTLKSGKGGFRQCAQNVERLKKCIQSQSLPKEPFAVDESVVALGLEELVQRVSIEDIQQYIVVSNVEVSCRKNSKEVRFTGKDNKLSEFKMTFFENENLLLPKVKRKDEKIKYVFKSIRKQLYNRFRFRSKSNFAVAKIKRQFNRKFLLDCPEAIKYFYSNDLSKKNLNLLSRMKKLIRNMNAFKNENYIKAQLEISVHKKCENFLANARLSVSEFKKILFDRQSKHTWILQDILNSILAFEEFFVFQNFSGLKVEKNENKL